MKITERDLYYFFPIITLIIFGCLPFYLSYFPSFILFASLMCGMSLLFMIYNAFIRRSSLQFQPYVILLFFIGLLMVFESNYRSGWGFQNRSIFAICIFLCFSALQGEDLRDVLSRILNGMLLLYCIFAVATCLCSAIPGLFKNHIIELFPERRSILLYQWSIGGNPGLTNHYSANGMLLATGFCVAFSKCMDDKKKKYIILSVFLYISLVMTGKRAHLLFSTFAAFLVIYLSHGIEGGINKRFKVILVTLTLIMFGYIIITLFGVKIATIDRFIDNDDMTNGRLKYWTAGLLSFYKNPIIGIGWKQYCRTIGAILSRSILTFDAHNVYIQLLCETGIIGAAIFLTWFISIYILTLRLFKQHINMQVQSEKEWLLWFSLSYQTFFLLYCFTGNPLYDYMTFIPYFISCSIALNYYIVEQAMD